MEATGVYWKPVFHALCEVDQIEVLLVNARHVKNVPGRKTDVKDSAWLAQLLECGLLRGSFIPPTEIAAIRELTRYRKKLIEERTRELQRLSSVLEDGGIKIDSVASTITTLSARDMIEALIAGERDPRVLAELARGRMRNKIPDLTMACAGRFGDHHALLARMHTDQIDHLATMIGVLDHRIEEVTDPFAEQLKLLQSIPGIGERAAQVIISEIGADMARFPPLRTWHPGPGCVPGTTNPPENTKPVGPVKATPRSAPSSPSAPGPQVAPAPTSARSSAACTAGSASRGVGRPPSQSRTPSS
jgi:transposase